jgi:hypothetical protein
VGVGAVWLFDIWHSIEGFRGRELNLLAICIFDRESTKPSGSGPNFPDGNVGSRSENLSDSNAFRKLDRENGIFGGTAPASGKRHFYLEQHKSQHRATSGIGRSLALPSQSLAFSSLTSAHEPVAVHKGQN